MKTLIILVFCGIVLIKFANGQDQDIEKVEEYDFNKNEVDISINELAGTSAKRKRVRKKKKNAMKRQKSTRTKMKAKKIKNRTKIIKRKEKKVQKRRQIKNRNTKRKALKKRRNRKNNAKKSNKQRKNRRKKKTLKNKNRRRKIVERQGTCETGCTDIIVQMMKENRRITTFLKQYNRIINGQKRADSKISKKGNFDKEKDDSPLKLMLEAGGGNKSDMECAGSKKNPAAVLMTNITEKLDVCAEKIGTFCNKSMWSEIKPEWVACNASMISLTNLTNGCIKKPGKSACDCFNSTEIKDGLKKIKVCNSTEMLKAANNDKKLKKSCVETYAECRHVGEETRKVISVCAPGGPALEDITKHMGIAKRHYDTTLAIQKKVQTLLNSRRYRIRKERSVIISGTTYALEACLDWATACHKFFDELANPANDEVVDAGDTIKAATVTCSATDKAKLGSLLRRAEHMLRRLAHFIKHTGEKIGKISGSTVSVEHAVSIFVAGKPTKHSQFTTRGPGDDYFCPQYKKDIQWMKGEKGFLGSDKPKSPRDCQRYCHQYNAKLNPNHYSTQDPKKSTPNSKDSTPDPTASTPTPTKPIASTPNAKAVSLDPTDFTPNTKSSVTPNPTDSTPNTKPSLSGECVGFTYWNQTGPWSTTTWCFLFEKPTDGVVIENTAYVSQGAISGLVLDCQPGNHDGTIYPTFSYTGATPSFDITAGNIDYTKNTDYTRNTAFTVPGISDYTKPGGTGESKPSQASKDPSTATKPSESSKDSTVSS